MSAPANRQAVFLTGSTMRHVVIMTLTGAIGLMTMFAPLSTLGPFILAKWEESAGSYAPGIIGFGVLAVFGGLMAIVYSRGEHERTG